MDQAHSFDPRRPAHRSFCGRTRREFLWETGGGFGSVALTALLGPTDSSPGRPSPPTASRRSSTRWLPGCRRFRPRPRASSSCSCTAARATSIRSTISRISTRSTARRSRSRRSAAAARRTRGGSSGPSGRSSQYGQCGKWVSDLFPQPGDLRRRHRLHPLDVCRVADPRLGHADDEFRPAALAETPAWAPGSPTAWAAKTRTCPASWSCSTARAARSAARRTGRAATCRPPFRRPCSDPTACRSTTWPRRAGIERATRRLLARPARARKTKHHLAARGR